MTGDYVHLGTRKGPVPFHPRPDAQFICARRVRIVVSDGRGLVRGEHLVSARSATPAVPQPSCRLAHQVRETAAQHMHLRTGVNTAEVVVGGEDGDLMGDPSISPHDSDTQRAPDRLDDL